LFNPLQGRYAFLGILGRNNNKINFSNIFFRKFLTDVHVYVNSKIDNIKTAEKMHFQCVVGSTSNTFLGPVRGYPNFFLSGNRGRG
jgi:hypothetical protein